MGGGEEGGEVVSGTWAGEGVIQIFFSFLYRVFKRPGVAGAVQQSPS